ncbi:hypothetical protein TWF694_010653 [Orbilia ellipsospora]|uniref:F-box domain-containing protein n=1 Tax=Orbilia ellipsospora TaxID=2528407 RepID=A0AAV9XGU5_9PEZI
MELSPLECLPDELIAHILMFLDIASIISLHRVSSRIRSISRYDRLWRNCCFQPYIHHSRQDIRDQVFRSSPRTTQSEKTQISGQTDRSRSSQPYVLDWEDITIDWYKEFQYRHAKLTNKSFIKFQTPHDLELVDVTLAGGSGMGLDQTVAATTLEDGSICIFSLSNSKAGKILGRSKSDLIPRKSLDTKLGRENDITGGANRERGLFVDAATAYGNRAWFGAGSVLTEIDLTTMQKIRNHRLPFSVTCLSTAMPILAVGTSLTIHLLDSRSAPDNVATASITTSDTTSTTEMVDTWGRPASHLSRLKEIKKIQTPLSQNQYPSRDSNSDDQSSRDYLVNAPPTAFLQPSPLSILHSPIDQACGNEMYVAGRFPSIMAYDRRQWPRLAGTLYSGARLSGLTLVATNPALELPDTSKYSLVACGEYGGRGTLELYPLPSANSGGHNEIPDDGGSPGLYMPSNIPSTQKLYAKSTSFAMKNRQSASRSKIFAVANQGIKIVTGDSEGCVRFIERDGINHIRDWVGPWGGIETAGGCIRKILPLSNLNIRPSIDNSDLLIVSEDDIGILTFNSPYLQSREELSSPPPSVDMDEELYIEAMRNALESHSSELRFLQELS